MRKRIAFTHHGHKKKVILWNRHRVVRDVTCTCNVPVITLYIVIVIDNLAAYKTFWVIRHSCWKSILFLNFHSAPYIIYSKIVAMLWSIFNLLHNFVLSQRRLAMLFFTFHRHSRDRSIIFSMTHANRMHIAHQMLGLEASLNSWQISSSYFNAS